MTRTLILINVVMYGMQMISGGIVEYYFALWPWGSEATAVSAPFRPWQVVTYGFMHDPYRWTHILFNMFGLFMFGSEIERSMGQKKYLAYYFVCVVGAAVFQMLATAVGLSRPALILGASGAVFGILLAYGVAFPQRRLFVIPIPIPIPAWLLVTIYGVLELWLGIFGRSQGVAHFAHLGGALAGYLLILYWRHGRR